MKQRIWATAQRALDEEIERVMCKEKAESIREGREEKELKQAVEPSAVTNAIRDILSIPSGMRIPGTPEERELFEKIICLMNFRNRKWLREIQVALPYSEMVGVAIPKEAALKLRVTLDEAEAAEERTRCIDLRNYFIHLVQLCVPEDERTQHPSLLIAETLETSMPGVQHVGVLESPAYSLACYYQQKFAQCERESRPEPIQPDTLTHDALAQRYQLAMDNFLKMAQAISGRGFIHGPVFNTDSLFSRILVNSAFNRFLLEQWGYQRRASDAYHTQLELAKVLETTAPQGLLHLIKKHNDSGEVNFLALLKEVLAPHLEKAGGADKVLTANVLQRIESQVIAGHNSALLPEFAGEWSTNEWMLRYPILSHCTWLIVLTWSYLNGSTLPDDDANVHSSTRKLITRRSQTVEQGQFMSSLRRIFSTIFYSFPWAPGLLRRLQHHFKYWSGIRAECCRFVASELKSIPISWLEFGYHESLNVGVTSARKF